MATVGASVYSRYGFSDLLTALLALDVRVTLQRAGERALEDFLREPPVQRDILTAIHIRADGRRACYRTLRRSATDFDVLDLCMSVSPQNDWRLSVGARPGRAMRCTQAEALLARGEAEQAAEAVATQLRYGDNLRGSAEYRRAGKNPDAARMADAAGEWMRSGSTFPRPLASPSGEVAAP